MIIISRVISLNDAETYQNIYYSYQFDYLEDQICLRIYTIQILY